MALPRETPKDFGPLRVDMPQLRGYASLLDSVATDLGGCSYLADSYCSTSDFGQIVEDLTADYATLLPQLKLVLAENETVMRQFAVAIDRVVSEYETTDDGVASKFEGDGIDNTSGWATFPHDSVGTETPYASEGELPEVSFGSFFDKLAWALEKICGWDVRAEVTDWIAGDTVGLSTQAECWEIVGGRIATINSNIGAGARRIGDHWDGYASAVHASEMLIWDTALTDQASSLKDLGSSLRELAKEAVNVAQLVVDCIRLAVDLIASAWALQYIPVVGQVKLAQKAWNAYKTANKALAYLKMIWSAIRATKDLVIVMIDDFTRDALPGKPISV